MGKSKVENQKGELSVLDKAKRYRNEENRRWLRAGHADSYEEELNRVAFWVLEGSPAKGYIIEKRSGCIRLDASCRVIKRFLNLPNLPQNAVKAPTKSQRQSR